MEAVFLVQPWVQTRTAMDCCKLCYQVRDSPDHLECKRAHLTAYNSLLAVLKLERGAEFEEALKAIEDAKAKCLATEKPDNHCHTTSQQSLQRTLTIYDKILDDYRKRLPMRPAPKL